MSRDLRVEIAPNGQTLRLTLYVNQPGVPAAGLPFDRQIPNLTASVIDNLRRGEATPLEVQQVTAAISQWLLSITRTANKCA